MADTLRRRVAELLGWRVEARQPMGRWGGTSWVLLDTDGHDHFLACDLSDTEETTWSRAIEADALPTWDTDANAALALLAGVQWTMAHETDPVRAFASWESEDQYCVTIYREGRVGQIVARAAANTFARAACEAWCLWKEAAG